MQKNRGCLILEVPDSFLGDPILPVGVDAAVADALAIGCDVVYERVVCESAIVRMVMLYRYSSCLTISFESFLSL